MERTSVLLIDDDPDMATIAGRVVEKAGFRFLWARSAEEGLAEILDKGPAAVLLDHMLPDMNGLDFLRTLRNDPAYARYHDLPVMMLTAYEARRRDIDEMFRLGLWAYLQKPFGHRELVNVIWNAIERRRVLDGTNVGGNGSSRVAGLRRAVEVLRQIGASGLVEGEESQAVEALLRQLSNLSSQLLRTLGSKKQSPAGEPAGADQS